MKRVRRGRPLGDVSQQALRLIQRESLPVWRLRAELGLSYREAVHTVSKLRQGGHVVYGAPAPRPGTRPARLLVLHDPASRTLAPAAGVPLALPRGFFGPQEGDQ